MVFGARFRAAHGLEHFARGARGQHIAACVRHARKDRSYLRGGLALRENYLRHPSAQRTMMIELGKSEVFKGQMAQPLQRLRNVGAAFAHFVQQHLNRQGIHHMPSFSPFA